MRNTLARELRKRNFKSLTNRWLVRFCALSSYEVHETGPLFRKGLDSKVSAVLTILSLVIKSANGAPMFAHSHAVYQSMLNANHSIKTITFSQNLHLKPNQKRRKIAAYSNNQSSQSPRPLNTPGLPFDNPATTAALIFEILQAGAAKVQRSLTPPPPGFPRGPPGDAALDLLGDPLAFLERTQEQYGDVVGITLGGERAVLVADPNAAKTVLIDAPNVYIKSGTAFFPGSSLAGNGLLVSDGEIWRRQRQLATPAFRRVAVERYASAMVDCTMKTLLKGSRWRQGAIRDVYSDFNELTLQITLTALFGATDLNSTDAKVVIDSIKRAFEYFSRRGVSAFVIPESFPTPDNLEFGAAVARLDTAVYGLIAKRRAELNMANNNSNDDVPQKSNNRNKNSEGAITSTSRLTSTSDLLTALIIAQDEGGVGMDDKSLRDELMTLLVAGQETSAILLGWACALLAANPQIQKKAAEEVRTVLNGRTPEPRDAQGSLPYIESIVLETMRLRPPAYLLGRCTAVDTELHGHALPAGTTILISPYIMHRDSKIWGSDAEIFNPERWVDPNLIPGITEQLESKKKSLGMMAISGMGPNGAYLPFGAGQRVCIGAGFAMTEAVLVLAAVLQRFELCPVLGSKQGALPEAEPRITLRPKQVRIMLRGRRKRKVLREENMGGEGESWGVPNVSDDDVAAAELMAQS